MYKRGQLSLEFLLIFAIFISALAIFLNNFLEVKNKFENSLSRFLIIKYGNDLENVINSMCILGDGNIRYLDIYFLGKINLSYVNKELLLKSGNVSYTIKPKCTIELINSTIINSERIRIETKNEKIVIAID